MGSPPESERDEEFERLVDEAKADTTGRQKWDKGNLGLSVSCMIITTFSLTPLFFLFPPLVLLPLAIGLAFASGNTVESREVGVGILIGSILPALYGLWFYYFGR
jgi:hypothetical protein